MRRQDGFQGGGRLRTKLKFYSFDDSGSPTHSLKRTPVFEFVARGNVSPYQGVTSREADVAVVGEMWSTVFIRYHRGRVPKEGWRIEVLDGDDVVQERHEVRGVQPIDYENRKVELTTRLIRDEVTPA